MDVGLVELSILNSGAPLVEPWNHWNHDGFISGSEILYLKMKIVYGHLHELKINKKSTQKKKHIYIYIASSMMFNASVFFSSDTSTIAVASCCFYPLVVNPSRRSTGFIIIPWIAGKSPKISWVICAAMIQLDMCSESAVPNTKHQTPIDLL